jgi:hypothetical protein
LEPSNEDKEEARMAKRKRSQTYLAVGPALGNFILGETPYPNPSYPNAGPTLRKKTYGPGTKFNTKRPFGSPDVRSSRATLKNKKLTKSQKNKILRSGLFWKVGPGKPHRMSKVIRIPYTYFDPVDQKVVQTALVVGYEGAGGGC